jgi:hypothetical protein
MDTIIIVGTLIPQRHDALKSFLIAPDPPILRGIAPLVLLKSKDCDFTHYAGESSAEACRNEDRLCDLRGVG